MVDLTGKVAVVLGASAKGGTGWTIAEALAGAGAKLVVGARSLEPLKRLADQVGGTAVACDGGDEAQITALRDATLDRYGRIDIAINSAATTTTSLISEVTAEVMKQAVQVNLFGMTYFVRDMAAGMTDGGSIILISSMSATHPLFPVFSYAAAKAGMECMVKYAAIEYGPRRIRVNAIRIGTAVGERNRGFWEAPGVREQFVSQIPLGRPGRPEDMAHAALWLADSPFVSGSMLDVAGGNQLTRFPMIDWPGRESASRANES